MPEEIKPAEGAVAAAAVAAVEEKKVEAAITPEELDARRKAFLESSFPTASYADRTKAKAAAAKETKDADEAKLKDDAEAKAKEEADQAAADAEARKKAEEAAAKPKPKKKADKPAAAPAPDAVETAANSIADAVEARFGKKESEQAQPQTNGELDDEAKAKLEVIAKLEAIDPRYAGYSRRTPDFWRKEADHIEEWKKANPDEEYDPSDKVHAKFYSDNEPFIDERDFAKAEKALSKERFDREVETAVERKLRPVEFRTRLRDETPAIHAAADAGVLEFIEAASPEFAALMSETDGAKHLTADAVKKFKEEFPVEDKILEPEAEKTRVLCAELELLGRFPSDYKIDAGRAVKLSSGESFKPHAELQDFADGLEVGLAAQPAEETTRADGRKFITQSAMRQQLQAIERGDARSRDAASRKLFQAFWTLDLPAIRRALIVERAGQVKKKIADLAGLMELKTKSAKSGGAIPAQSGKVPEAAVTAAAKPKAAPPSTASSSDKVAATAKGSGIGANSREDTLRSMGWA